MISDEEYRQRDATALAELVSGGEVSAQELLKAAIARIERLNPGLNAVVEELYDNAREKIEGGLRNGPFMGVPFLVKDLHTCVRQSRLTHGCSFFANHISKTDSAIIKKCRDAGLVIIGRTNSPEFGLNVTTEGRFLGICRNPWNTDVSTGGSSGGSAAAVASAMVPMAHATDSGGSIRIPASSCGLIGLKPTRGRILAGLDEGEGWHDTFNAFAVTRSLRDAAQLLDCLKNTNEPAPYYAPGENTSYTPLLDVAVKPLRIGVWERPTSGSKVSATTREELSRIRLLLEDLGHRTEPFEFVYDVAAAADAFLKVIASSVAATTDFHEKATGVTATPQAFQGSVWDALQIGRNLSGGELNAAVARVHLTGTGIVRQMEGYDIVLSPTVAETPLELGRLDANGEDVKALLAKVFAFAPFTSLYNISGQPAISLPIGWTTEGLPVGMQFAAKPGREDLLFQIASQLEPVCNWEKHQRELIDRLQ